MKKRILIVSHEAPGARMSGPAIRYWHLAHVLATRHVVCLAAPGKPQVTSDQVELAGYQRRSGIPLPDLMSNADVVIVAGFLLYHYPFLKEAAQPMVVDLYDPFVIENLEIHSSKPLESQLNIHHVNLAVLNEQLRRGDFFICAHEDQRDYWLGMLTANNRVNPYTLADDHTLRRLIDLVPFGIPKQPPRHHQRVLRDIYPGIGAEDKIVYWGGGIWDWFDPLTAIKAVHQVAQAMPEIRLFFAGTKHPNPDVPAMRMCEAARQLSDSLGITNQLVFFNHWTPYEKRGNYLLEADVGISLHFEHLETKLSFRTRLLDYVWAGLPMIVTRGDTISEMIVQRGLGIAVAPDDVPSLRDGLIHLLKQPTLRHDLAADFAAVQRVFTWSAVSAPLLAFCNEPYLAADHHLRTLCVDSKSENKPPIPVRVWQAWQRGGLGEVLKSIHDYVRWRFTI